VMISVDGIVLAFFRGLKAYQAEPVGGADLKAKFGRCMRTAGPRDSG